MKPNKRIAALAATAMAVGGFVAIASGGAANASSNSVHLYDQINNIALAGSTSHTPNDTVDMTVTPTSGGPNTPIEVSLTSPTLHFDNGPASQVNAGGEELDAVIKVNGNSYTLRGPINAGCVDKKVGAFPGIIFDTGWVVSSTAGNSSATTPVTSNVIVPSNPGPCPTTGSQPASLGLGTRNQGNESGSVVTLTAPSTAGVYNIDLKALVVNSITGSGAPELDSDFDDIYNIDTSCPAANCAGAGGTPAQTGSAAASGSFYKDTASKYISAAPSWGAVSFTVLGPQASVASAQNLGSDDAIGGTGSAADTTLTLGPGGVPYVRRQNDVINITGNSLWAASKSYQGAGSSQFINAGPVAYDLCPASAATPTTANACSPFVNAFRIPSATGPQAIPTGAVAGGIYTNASGQLQPFSLELTVGNVGDYNIWLVVCGGTTAPTNDCTNTANYAGATSTWDPAIQFVKIPIHLMGNRTISATPTTVSSGSPVPVTGSNWYPGETVTVKGGQKGANYVQTITNTAAVCSNGTPTVYAATSAVPSFTSGSYVTVSGATNGGGGPNANNVKATVFTADTSVLSPTSVTGVITGGTYTLTVANGISTQTTSALAFGANGATVQAALVALSNVGAAGATVSGSATQSRTIAFTANTNVLTANTAGLTGPGPISVYVIKSGPGFNYNQYGITCGANGLVFNGTDTGAIRANPGTPSSVVAGEVNTLLASGTGALSGTVSIADITDNEYYATGLQSDNGAANPAPVQNYAEGGSFAVSADSCVAVSNGNHSNNSTVNTGLNAADGLATPGSCSTQQTLNVTVTGGTLRQDASVVATPNPNGSFNTGATVVNFGSIQSAVTTGSLGASLNQVKVSDSRGGTFGWSLTATAPSFAGSGTHSIANSNLSASPTCVIDAAAPLSAGGQTAGAGAQTFAGTVNLCTKNNAVNATTGSSGGVYDVNAPLTLSIPAFQAADTYSTVMTITLS